MVDKVFDEAFHEGGIFHVPLSGIPVVAEILKAMKNDSLAEIL